LRGIATAESTEQELKGAKLVVTPSEKRRAGARIRGVGVVLRRPSYLTNLSGFIGFRKTLIKESRTSERA
jgi:hypothetical protein